jgi:hypothetical protein
MKKNYSLSIETPLGSEKATMTLDSSGEQFTGAISIEKGSSLFETINIVDNSIKAHFKLDTPFPCDVTITGLFNEEKINGYILVDNFIQCPYAGEEI